MENTKGRAERMDVEFKEFQTKAEGYHYIHQQLRRILRETSDVTAALANASALLMLQLTQLNWAGFYLFKEGRLVLGPFQGKPAVAEIGMGDGVCGTAALTRKLRRVENVHSCCNHIACDMATNSEIVVPILDGGTLFGVLDLDSPALSRFDGEDEEGLQKSAEILASAFLPAQTLSASKEARLVALLAAKGWHISFAESCTGGQAAARLVNAASASSVFDASFVTYANEAKKCFLGVSPSSIAAHGVVSEPVAREMAQGAARAVGAQVGVGISGIAGPSGAVPGKPVGTVCFGFWIDGECLSATKHFGDIGRSAVRAAAVEFVYDTLLQRLS